MVDGTPGAAAAEDQSAVAMVAAADDQSAVATAAADQTGKTVKSIRLKPLEKDSAPEIEVNPYTFEDWRNRRQGM